MWSVFESTGRDNQCGLLGAAIQVPMVLRMGLGQFLQKLVLKMEDMMRLSGSLRYLVQILESVEGSTPRLHLPFYGARLATRLR